MPLILLYQAGLGGMGVMDYVSAHQRKTPARGMPDKDHYRALLPF
jgi:hypothetical protein